MNLRQAVPPMTNQKARFWILICDWSANSIDWGEFKPIYAIYYVRIQVDYCFAKILFCFLVMGVKGRRVHMIEEMSDTIISFQRGICLQSVWPEFLLTKFKSEFRSFVATLFFLEDTKCKTDLLVHFLSSVFTKTKLLWNSDIS